MFERMLVMPGRLRCARSMKALIGLFKRSAAAPSSVGILGKK
jgi:hypothetical protein